MLARTIFASLILTNRCQSIDVDGDRFGRLENVAFDLQTQIQHLSDQLNAQNIRMQKWRLLLVNKMRKLNH